MLHRDNMYDYYNKYMFTLGYVTNALKDSHSICSLSATINASFIVIFDRNWWIIYCNVVFKNVLN